MSALVAPPAFGDFTKLDDEMVKLVAYTIVSLLRDKEIIMPKGKDQVLVVDSMTPEQFVAQIIAHYTESKDYLPDPVTNIGLSEEQFRENQRYLRVYYVVSQRWPREPMKFEERQIRTLEEIKDSM
jgi:hypothetical protein